MSQPTVIVFGPTGNIASFAATTAHSHNAKVILAMRDPSKSIPGLTQDQEKSGSYTRIQADLTKPDTVTKAVQSTNATRALIYLAHGSQDHMRSTLEALKSAGITFVVFISSFTIGAANDSGEAKDVTPPDVIAYVHAQVELSLDAVFGAENYVAIRPGNFATNLLQNKDGIVAGEVKLYGGDFLTDNITPIDMGTVSGTILATQTGPKDKQDKVYLFGPQVISIADSIRLVGKVLNKEVKITTIGPDEAREQFEKNHMPKPFADYMVKKLGEEQNESKERPKYREGVDNVERYTGRKATGLEDWVRDNKELFA